MKLRDRLEYGSKQNASDQQYPVFGKNGQCLSAKKNNKSKKIGIMIGSICSFFAVLSLFLYVPQLFMQESEENIAIAEPDVTAIYTREQYILNHPDEDFDLDGLSN